MARPNPTVELDDHIETDVLVVGGGPAGSLAALSARNNGADVLLIERESFLGGNLSGSFVNTLNSYRGVTEEGNPVTIRGLAYELTERLIEADGSSLEEGEEPSPGFPGQYTDPMITIHVLDEMMQEANVDVLFNTGAFDTFVEDGEVTGVAISNKSGGQVVWADTVVDCSGDADVAAAAGAAFEFGREEDGEFHGGALLMQVGGFDFDRLLEYMSADHDITPAELEQIEEEKAELIGGGGPANVVQTRDGEETSGFGPLRSRDWEQMREDREAGRPVHFSVKGGPTGVGAKFEYEGDVPPEATYQKEWIDFIKSGEVPPWRGADDNLYPPPPSLGIVGLSGMFKHGKHRYDTMMTGVYEAWFDSTDEADISDAIIDMRKLNKVYLKFLRERIPGFEDAYIVNEAPKVGTRESRRIIGEYMLTADEMAEGKRFPDVIAKSGRPPSTHGHGGVWGTFVMGSIKRPFDIPYRCLVPRDVDDLLVAGRSISVTHHALGGIRDQAICMATGETAGAAAALSSRLDVAPRELDVDLLQKRLLDQGVYLFDENEEDKREAVLDAEPLKERLI